MNSTFAEIDRVSKLPSDDEGWVEFVGGTLKMQGCYVPAAQVVLAESGWRRMIKPGDNPLGYIKTAVYRGALRMGLGLDRFDANEPRVITKDRLVELQVPDGANYEDSLDRLQASGRGALTKSEGKWRQAAGFDWRYDDPRTIPAWLRRRDDSTAVDWERVARYAVLKPHMAEAVGKVLTFRAQGVSRDEVVRRTKTRDRKKIENAWKWVDREAEHRIKPLFSMDCPPGEQAIVPAPAHPTAGFLAPAEALRRTNRMTAADALSSGPSLYQPVREDWLLRYAREARLPAGTTVTWSHDGLSVKSKPYGSLDVFEKEPRAAFEIAGRFLELASALDFPQPFYVAWDADPDFPELMVVLPDEEEKFFGGDTFRQALESLRSHWGPDGLRDPDEDLAGLAR